MAVTQTVLITTIGAGTYIVPPEWECTLIELWGNGGRGGEPGVVRYCGGGGGGAYCAYNPSAPAGTTILFSVGSDAGSANTYCYTYSLIAHAGTQGGVSPTSGDALGGAGGTATGGSTNISGTAGSNDSGTTGGAGGAGAGASGSSGGGAGGAGGSIATPGSNGTAPGGGGGGGGYGIQLGGVGGQGQIQFTLTATPNGNFFLNM